MGQAPLDDGRIATIRACIDAGELDRAERLLAALDAPTAALPASRYLAVRLEFESERMEANDVVRELEQLVSERPDFTDAVRMLQAARGGDLVRRTLRSPPPDISSTASQGPSKPADGTLRASRGAPATDRSGARQTTRPPATAAPHEDDDKKRELSEPKIPRAPMVPVFGPPADSEPSYVPAPPPATRRDLQTPGSRKVVPGASPEPSEAPSGAPDVYRPRRSSTQPSRMRSGRPPEMNPDGAQSLLGIATLLDEGLYAQALSALDRVTGNAGPAFTLMRARALYGAERKADARILLERLCGSDVKLPADVRAGCARLLLELDDPERALKEAERAYHEDPRAPVTTQTLVWALCRTSWQHPDMVERIPKLLSALESDSNRGPRLALAQSLKAYVACTIGGAEHGAEMAEAALELDPRSRDALLALAIAWARLGDRQRSAHYAMRFSSQFPGSEAIAQKAVAHWVARDRTESV